jgi:hypothetical protein
LNAKFCRRRRPIQQPVSEQSPQIDIRECSRDARYEEAATLAEFQITIFEHWAKAIKSAGDDIDYGWGVFAFD